MYVPQEPGMYEDVQGDLWSRDSDGWRWLGRRTSWTGKVIPADPGHGPLPDRVLGMLVESPDDAVLPLTRVEIENYPPDSWTG